MGAKVAYKKKTQVLTPRAQVSTTPVSCVSRINFVLQAAAVYYRITRTMLFESMKAGK